MAVPDDELDDGRQTRGRIAAGLVALIFVVSVVLAVADDDRSSTVSVADTTTSELPPVSTTRPAELAPFPLPIGAVVSHRSGLDRVTPEGTMERIWDQPTGAAYAVGDHVVAQAAQEDPTRSYPPPRVNSIVVFRDGEQLEIAPEPGQDLTLHDAGLVGGRAVAVVSAASGHTPETRDERLLLVDLATGARSDLGSTGGWESGVRQAHLTSEHLVTLLQIEARSFLLVRRHDGSVLWEGEAVVDRAVAIVASPTEVLEVMPSFEEPAFRPHLRVTRYDAATGEVLAIDDLELSGADAVMHGFCFATEWVVGGLLCDQSEGPPVWIDLKTGSVARVGNLDDGVVTLPRGTQSTDRGDGLTWGGRLSRLDDGTLRADGFDEWLQENPVTSPETAALILVGESGAEVDASVGGSVVTVSVTVEVVDDDSVSGTRYVVRFRLDGDRVVAFDGGTWGDRCGRGDDTTTFAPRPCP